MKRCLMILTVILVLALTFVLGRSSPTYIMQTQAEKLSLDYQTDFMRDNGLVRINSWDAMEPLRQGGFKKELEKLKSARWIWIEPLRKSSVPYVEIEQHVTVWKTEESAKEAFRRLEPASYQLIQIPRIGDETNAWKTRDETFIVMFRKGTVEETVKVKFNMSGTLEEPFFTKYLLPACLEIANKAADAIPD